MKKVLKIFTLLSLLVISVSCTDNESNLSQLENQALSPEVFFEKISKMDLKTSKENIIYIEYKWNAQNETMEYLGYEEKEPDFFILEPENKRMESDYEVTCDNGGDGSTNWTKGCDGKLSCGRLIYKCLQGGGCATICSNKIAYVPQYRTFYVLN